MADQKLIWDDSIRLMVTCKGKIYSLVWIDVEDVTSNGKDVNLPNYTTGWYYDEDGPPSFMGRTKEEAVKETRTWFGKKQQIDHWRDEDLLYALCAVCKRLDEGDRGDDKLNLRSAFIQVGYGATETDLALDLIYQKVLE